MTRIHEACDRAGFHVVTEGSDDPTVVLTRLLDALRILAPEIVLGATIFDLEVPPDALADEAHAWWSSEYSETILGSLFQLLTWNAPPGFVFTAEGNWNRLGFFRLQDLPEVAASVYELSTAPAESLYSDGRPGGQRRFGDWRCPPTYPCPLTLGTD
jgi:hypothetical protein